MKRILPIVALFGALIVPSLATAQDRFHDRRHHDDHEWNPREDRAYHMYYEQRHKHFVEWSRASERDRQRYWDWRHNHSDALLKIDIR